MLSGLDANPREHLVLPDPSTDKSSHRKRAYGFRGTNFEVEYSVELSVLQGTRLRLRNLGIQSPVPQVICIKADAEKIAGKESEFRGTHSDDANDDAIRPGNYPALP
jgi:hypothetical protein